MGWPLGKIKRYPHFDAMASLHELTALATNPQAVDRNAFLPFLLYYKRWNSFQSLTKESKNKERPIRYASRKDGAIFAYYRHLLSERYETALVGLGFRTVRLPIEKYRPPPVPVENATLILRRKLFRAYALSSPAVR